MLTEDILKELKKLSDPEKAKVYPRFFKAGPGEYAEGDKFLGVTVPGSRQIASKFKDIDLKVIQSLLSSEFHEARWVALFILIERYNKADKSDKKEILDFYLNNIRYINNWDLVDSSAPGIVGDYLYNNPEEKIKWNYRVYTGTELLDHMAISNDLWIKRISMISTFRFIRSGETDIAFSIALILLGDRHDLIHKAVGWMLREAGKKDPAKLDSFLQNYYDRIPRTSLRYAIEKFPMDKRKKYLQKDF